ncbi:uncharacterized protein UDID_02281 [Ustilago sp. UG-2017a]|nr:uncharacterized protein UDID_02281 [Ustilago sp. UG-2017a]SPC66780.1 uncharacterized protein UHOD_02281 [Ustilago sp. UG-2017b]
MASASGSSAPAAASGSAQNIDVDIEEDVRAGGVAEGMDEDATPAGEGAQTPQSVNTTADAEDDSDLAASFYQSNSSKKRQTASKLTDDSAAVVDDDDDLMEPELPAGREERLLDEKIRARYIQEIGDIF